SISRPSSRQATTSAARTGSTTSTARASSSGGLLYLSWLLSVGPGRDGTGRRDSRRDSRVTSPLVTPLLTRDSPVSPSCRSRHLACLSAVFALSASTSARVGWRSAPFLNTIPPSG